MKLRTSVILIALGLALTTGLAFADDPHNQVTGGTGSTVSNAVDNSNSNSNTNNNSNVNNLSNANNNVNVNSVDNVNTNNNSVSNNNNVDVSSVNKNVQSNNQSQTLISGVPGGNGGHPLYFSSGSVIVGTDGAGHNVFIVKPRVKQFAPGVESIDGVIRVDGLQSTCDQLQRGGLPKCFTIGDK